MMKLKTLKANTDYIRITDLKQIQLLLLLILKRFHQFCEENGLIYNIFGGTMLGAVRHGGMIPWDDDIDVTMPRDHYNKMLSLLRENTEGLLTLHAFPDSNYIYPYAKVGLKGTFLFENVVKAKYNCLSLNIDVFPNDGYPTDESVFQRYNEIEEKIILKAYKLHYPLKRIPGIMIRRLSEMRYSVEYYVGKQVELMSEFDEKTAEFISCQGAGWGTKGKLKRDVYYDRVLYDFNGMQVWGIRDYDEHLSNLYGDYMKLPPKEKRGSPHQTDIWVNRKYVDK